ncbi:hypothetical protein [Ohessyouella blattaphilus]|uniref:Uncharacterized protein n=1 Tax=Ohessyouella blattaphilus TaxID=2949333 RepID=A0ABT1EED9_9FIRM|nr:hypothetical protein [Ohessyouella blattaphilus]MCP1108859.1 hypothetical protein [Ohessyouella blattaphilus]MCR8562253.1 hypothetical protein [Ohessyouella blattaphilus]
MIGTRKIMGILLLILLTCQTTIVSAQEDKQKIYTPEEVTEVKRAGTYPVKIAAQDEGEEIEGIVYITVTYDYTVTSKVHREGIDASDFEFTKAEEMKEFTKTEMIRRARAHAWSLEDGSEVPITKVVTNQITENYGEISYSTQRGTTITIHAYRTGAEIFSRKDFIYMSLDKESSLLQWEDEYILWFAMAIILLVLVPVMLIMALYVFLSRARNELSEFFISYAKKKDIEMRE